MKVSVSRFKKVLREYLIRLMEDQDRVRRHEDGYGDNLEEMDPGTYNGPPNQGFGDSMAGHYAKVTKDSLKNFLNLYNAEKDPKSKETMRKVALAVGVKPQDLGEDQDRTRRHEDGYGDDLEESAPNSEKAEDFIKKNKEDFKKRYGARWEKVLYATANKKFKDK